MALSDYFSGTDLPNSFLQQYINPSKKEALSQPIDWSKYPAFKGMDLSKGIRDVDLTNPAYTGGAYSYSQPVDQGFNVEGTLADTGAVPKTDAPGSWYEQLMKFQKESYPLERQKMIDQYRLAADLGRQQMLESYPILSQAAWDATQRNLYASKNYRAFAEGLPSNVQNIMTAKQAQMASAASSEAERGRAIAAQQDAATNFRGRYQGKNISYA